MIHMVAKEAENHFGQLLTAAMKEPVVIDKNGKSVAVLMSMEDYEPMEDALLILRADAAAAEGFLSEEESEKFHQELLNAKT